MIVFRHRICTLLCTLLLLPLLSSILSAQSIEHIAIDTHAAVTPFPHFWENTFGSGRAALGLRDQYRNDLADVHDNIGMRYVRAHGILHDELGVYEEDEHGNAIYNFSYVDQIYDGLLARGVRPLVEISFMPKALAAEKNAIHPFWYKQNVSAPKDYAKWDALIHAFAQHLVDRYGIDEVSQWYFEVWNEPNIDFWAGEPKQATYFELYDHTARSLKQVSPRLRVGGPATAAAHWIPEFLAHVSGSGTPIDFVSTHGYADDTVKDLFGTNEEIPMSDRVCRAVAKVRHEIRSSALPSLPLFWTEWNVPSYDKLNARDLPYVATALAHDIHDCDGLAERMSFWTFDDVFEEGGVPHRPFDGTFGLITFNGIRKPSYYGFALLHKLGTTRIANPSADALVTRREDGTLVIALWNQVEPDRLAEGSEKTVHLTFSGTTPNAHILIERTDNTHGNPLPAYRAIGSPQYPTASQIATLNKAGTLPAAEERQLKGNELTLTLPVNGLAVVEIR